MAVSTDLAVGPGQDVNSTHLEHGGDEVGEEEGLVARISLHGGAGGGVLVQHLVGEEEPPPLQQVEVVAVVEHGGRRGGIVIDQAARLGAVQRALLDELVAVVGVERAVVAAQPVGNGGAVCLPDGVRP